MTESLGAKIKRLRDEQGLSQLDLATLAELSDSYISRLENDDYTKQGPSAKVLARIATALKVPIEEFITEPPAAAQQGKPRRRPREGIRQLQALWQQYAPMTIPLVDQRAAAGYIGGYVSPGEAGVVDLDYVPTDDERGHKLLGIRVSGTCLEPLIMDGHIAIVDRSIQPRSGDAVLAIHEGEAILKILEIRDGRPYLVALQGDIVIAVNESTRIEGVVKSGQYSTYRR